MLEITKNFLWWQYFQERIESTKGMDIFEQLKKMKNSISENIEKQNKLLEESKTANELAPVLWKFQKKIYFVFSMIKAILIFNNQGKPRLTKFYQHYTEKEQQGIIEVRFLQK